MRYVVGADREEGCIFCNRLGEEDDVRSLILVRGQRAFVIMNLYPYNTGHVMIVPNAHVASPEDAEPDVMSEMTVLRGPVLRSLRRALSPDGFNLGLNVGAPAGAGVADELEPDSRVTNVVIADDRRHVLVDAAGRLPQAESLPSEPVWKAAMRDALARGAIDAELLGWAGDRHAGSARSALLLRASFPSNTVLPSGSHLAPVNELLTGRDAPLLRAALQDRVQPSP